MRIVLWLLVLVTVCAALLLWNERVSVEARAEREALRAGSTPDADGPTGDDAQGFGHVIVGEKSGAPILEPQPRVVPPPAGTERTARTQKSPSKPAGSAPDPNRATEYTVAAGESLSTICQRHYGTSHPDVVAAVARANKLGKADQIRAGMKIVLPASAEVIGKH